MSKILFFDLECNSLDTNNGFIQEIAWTIYDLPSMRLTKAHSSLLKWDQKFEVEPGALEATRLPCEMSERCGAEAKGVLSSFIFAVQSVDYICGHNIVIYDVPMTKSNLIRALGDNKAGDFLSDKICIDTLIDIPYPATQKIMSLKYLAYDHGHILSGAHEALNDIGACAHLFRSYFDNGNTFKRILESANSPMIKISVSYSDNKEIPKEIMGKFRFYYDKESKAWNSSCRLHKFNSLVKEELKNSNVVYSIQQL